MLEPLLFTYNLEDGMSESEFEGIYTSACNCQKSLDSFLSGDCTEDEFCDVLRFYGLDPDEVSYIYNDNLKFMRLI